MRDLLLRLSVCLTVFGFCLYSYLDFQNRLTGLKMQIPALEKELYLISEENKKLSYEIGQFQSPSHLIELAHCPEFSHLKHPLLKEILTVPEVIASNQ